MGKMGDTLVIDSDVLIDLLRNKVDTINWFKENKDKFQFATTVINLFELYVGAYKSINKDKEIKDILDLIERFTILDFTIECAEESGKQRASLEKKGQILESRDIIIGSIAITNNSPLKTNNKKHFERIMGLRLVE